MDQQKALVEYSKLTVEELQALGVEELSSVGKRVDEEARRNWTLHARVLIAGRRLHPANIDYGKWLTETYGAGVTTNWAGNIYRAYEEWADSPLIVLPRSTLVSLSTATDEVVQQVLELVEAGELPTRAAVRKLMEDPAKKPTLDKAITGLQDKVEEDKKSPVPMQSKALKTAPPTAEERMGQAFAKDRELYKKALLDIRKEWGGQAPNEKELRGHLDAALRILEELIPTTVEAAA